MWNMYQLPWLKYKTLAQECLFDGSSMISNMAMRQAMMHCMGTMQMISQGACTCPTFHYTNSH